MLQMQQSMFPLKWMAAAEGSLELRKLAFLNPWELDNALSQRGPEN